MPAVPDPVAASSDYDTLPRQQLRGPAGMATLLLLAAGYAVVAGASLQLSFAHTNATPLWPPSGIALAAIILIGYRAWPAIMLGA